MTQQFTASEVRHLSNRIPRNNDEIADAQEALRAYADMLEAREKAVPVATCGHSSTVEHRASNANVVGSNPIARSNSDAERLAEALRQIAVTTKGYPNASREGEIAIKALAAHSAKAQPPAARVTDTLAVFEVVSGVEGPCLTISRKADGKPRHEYRLAGPKPWGGGNTTHSFKVHTRELREQIDAIEAALAAQENHNGL